MLGFVSLARLSEAAGSARGETAPPGLGVVEVAPPQGGGEILAGGVAGRVTHLHHTLQLSLVKAGTDHSLCQQFLRHGHGVAVLGKLVRCQNILLTQ